MKKFAVVAVVLCVALMMAVPASALEITTDGYFRARYLAAFNAKMEDKKATNAATYNNAANSYGDYRLRVNNVFKVNDNLMLRTRFHAMNGTRWGGASADASNFDWKRAWMVAKFNWGIMEVGRMQGGTWGTSFADLETDADRVKFTFPMGPVTLLAIYQKSAERDTGITGDNGFSKSDTDADTLYLAGVWKAETMSAGLLGAYTWNKTRSDTFPGVAVNDADRAYANPWALLPFFTGKWGAFGFSAEGKWTFGDYTKWVDDVPGRKDGSYKGWSLNLEGTFDFGMGNAQLGWAYATGWERKWVGGTQVYSEDNGAGDIGADWAKLLILTGDTGPQSGTGVLGGFGAFGAGGNRDGISLLYGGADFKPMENLSLGFLIGYGNAQETWSGQDKALGWEVDFIAAYTIFDNLTNTFKVGYLSGGDYWKGSKYDPNYANNDNEFNSDVWVVQNELKLSF